METQQVRGQNPRVTCFLYSLLSSFSHSLWGAGWEVLAVCSFCPSLGDRWKRTNNRNYVWGHWKDEAESKSTCYANTRTQVQILRIYRKSWVVSHIHVAPVSWQGYTRVRKIAGALLITSLTPGSDSVRETVSREWGGGSYRAGCVASFAGLCACTGLQNPMHLCPYK